MNTLFSIGIICGVFALIAIAIAAHHAAEETKCKFKNKGDYKCQ